MPTYSAAVACAVVWRLLPLPLPLPLVWPARIALWVGFARLSLGIEWFLSLVAGPLMECCCDAAWRNLGSTLGITVARGDPPYAHRTSSGRFLPKFSPIPEMVPARSYDRHDPAPRTSSVGTRYKRRSGAAPAWSALDARPPKEMAL